MEVRNLLLDLIAEALEDEVPEAKARMIRLEAKQAAVISAPEVTVSADLLSSLSFIPISVLVIPGNRPIIALWLSWYPQKGHPQRGCPGPGLIKKTMHHQINSTRSFRL